MSYAEILVQSGTDAGASRRLMIAKNLAERLAAKLVGVFLEPSAPAPFYASGIDVPAPQPVVDDLLRQHRENIQMQANKAQVAFEREVGDRGGGWRTFDGGSPEALTRAARVSDLLIMAGPRDNLRDGVFAPADAVVLASGAPAIAIPDTATVSEVGRQVVVAWNGSREAARAVRDALPILRMAGRVTGVIVGHPEAARDGELALQALFDRQGCEGSVVRLPQGGSSASDVLLRHAAGVGADLIVMGLYGHSRFREFVLGGVSRGMLERSPLPLFLAH